MTQEIERKFLIADDSWRDEVIRRVYLRDGLLAFLDGLKVRIRFYDDRATLTVKSPRKGIARDEFEYDIPSSDGLTLLEEHCGEVLEKTRYFILCDGFEWAVDEYHGILAGTVIAEIELPSEDSRFTLPHWLGREVTGIPEYRKMEMVAARRKEQASV
jgi:adenylate cyclase